MYHCSRSYNKHQHKQLDRLSSIHRSFLNQTLLFHLYLVFDIYCIIIHCIGCPLLLIFKRPVDGCALLFLQLLFYFILHLSSLSFHFLCQLSLSLELLLLKLEIFLFSTFFILLFDLLLLCL